MAKSEKDDKARLDRELIELLNELRVALPGVQVLFAFLLTVPFTVRFQAVTEFQKHTYFAVLLLTLFSSILLIAPSAYHRLSFREGAKVDIVKDGNRLALTGLAFLALAMTGVVMLISDLLFQPASVAVFTAATMLAFAVLWWALPQLRNR